MRRTAIKRTAAKLARPRDTGPRRVVRVTVATRAGGRCEMTGCPLLLEHQHHRLPRRQGGTARPEVNQPSNIVGLCAPHHGWVESHRADAYALGLLVRAGMDPAAVPVLLRHHREPVLLDDEGGWTAVPTDTGVTLTPQPAGGPQ